MTLCQHEDCERDGIAAWNGCVFCDEHVRERLRTTADANLKAENERLRAAWIKYGRHKHDCQRYGEHQCTCGYVEACIALASADAGSGEPHGQ